MSERATFSGTLLRIDLAGMAAAVGITAGAYVMVFEPLSSAQSKKAANQSEVSVRQQKISDLNAEMNGLRQDLAKLHATLESSSIELLSAHQSNQRLADLTQLAQKHSLDIHEIRTGEILSGSGHRYDIIPIRLGGVGTFQACNAFLHHLRTEFPDTGVVGVDLANNPVNSTTPANFRFDLSWYAATSLTNAGQ